MGVNKQTIGVVGAGLMGHGIAYLLAAAGHDVGIFEPSAETRASLAQRLRDIIDLLGDAPVVLDRISVHDNLAGAVRSAQFVFEAAPEKLDLKRRIFAELEGLVAPDTIHTVVKSGFGARMAVLGPFEQSDLVGLDLTLDISKVLVADLDRTAEPHPFLREKVKAGKLGMKTGEGFRRWTPEQANEVRERLRRYLAEQARSARGKDR